MSERQRPKQFQPDYEIEGPHRSRRRKAPIALLVLALAAILVLATITTP
jgi:hypothetical protein